ncbi:MAG: hypothetical protein MRZ79_09055 [Bacteroidia bacterium]|nr:hypothetical protein [Bacteroidia bacterium]
MGQENQPNQAQSMSQVQKAIKAFKDAVGKEESVAQGALDLNSEKLEGAKTTNKQAKQASQWASRVLTEYEKLNTDNVIALTQDSINTNGTITAVKTKNDEFKTALTTSVASIKDLIEKLKPVANAACEVSNSANSGKVQADLPKDFVERASMLEMDAGALLVKAQRAFNKSVKTAGLFGLLGMENLQTSIGKINEDFGSLKTGIETNVTDLTTVSATASTDATSAHEEEIKATSEFNTSYLDHEALSDLKKEKIPPSTQGADIDKLIEEAQKSFEQKELIPSPSEDNPATQTDPNQAKS